MSFSEHQQEVNLKSSAHDSWLSKDMLVIFTSCGNSRTTNRGETFSVCCELRPVRVENGILVVVTPLWHLLHIDGRSHNLDRLFCRSFNWSCRKCLFFWIIIAWWMIFFFFANTLQSWDGTTKEGYDIWVNRVVDISNSWFMREPYQSRLMLPIYFFTWPCLLAFACCTLVVHRPLMTVLHLVLFCAIRSWSWHL